MEGKGSLWMEIGFQQCCIAAVCVICLLVVIFLKSSRYFRGGDNSKTNSNNDTFSGPCKFPDCVRCRRHKDLLTRARTKLTYYEDSSSKNSTSASALLLTDVQASYRKLGQNGAAGDAGKYDISVQNSLVFHVKGIRAQPEWSVDEFPGLETLTDNLEHIQSEFWELRHGDTYASYWKGNETPAGRWGICHLLDQGVQTKAAAACPITWQVVSRLPAVMTNNVFGNVAFSVVEPGTRIAPHFGPSNIRIRCHLGLQIPAACQLKVGSTSLQWSEGQMICFDETYLHSVQHDGKCLSDSARVILIMDLWHPDLNPEQRHLLDYAFSSASVLA